MKILSTISLFIFGVVLTSILTAGLVFYQNNKLSNQANNQVKNSINNIIPAGESITLDIKEISKHNVPSNCWIIISDKVYDITSYFGSHPGGNSTMSPTCGVDATVAYTTRDPNAKTSSGSVQHSSDAKNLLNDYYIGDLNQIIVNNNTQTNLTETTNSQIVKPQTNNSIPIKTNVIVTPPSGNVTLNMTEILKHNKSTDCWMLISGKVYNITSYFGSHPGGNSPMAATCGEDATAEYATKNPGATTSTGGQSHSSSAAAMLGNYFIGNLDQVIGQKNITQTNSVIAPTSTDDDEDDD